MVPLGYNDKPFVYLQDCLQQTANNSPAHHYTSDKLNQSYSQPMCKEQPQNTVVASPSSFNKKAQSFSALSPLNSKVTKGSYNRAMKSSSPSLYSKCPATTSKDSLLKSSSQLSWKSLDSSLPHHKSQTSSSFTSTSSLEPSKTSPRSRLPLPKTQTSSSIDLCWKSPSLESTQRISTSSSPPLDQRETSSLNIIWSTPSLESSQSERNSQLCKSKSQKDSSLDCLWTSLLESNQKTLSSPSLTHKLQRPSFSSTSALESNRVVQTSPLSDCKSLKIPISNSNNNVFTLPLSQAKSRKLAPSSHSFLPSRSLSTCQPKPKIAAKCDPSTRAISATACQPKVQNTASLIDKHRLRQLPSVHTKPNISGHRILTPKPGIKTKNASVPCSRLPNKCSFEKSVKSEAENESLWSLDYSHPCIIKGGSVPVDVVNKIVNSISKSTIQKDLSRQILLRRMRGKPNPRPGPRLSSTYSVCLECASAIKSQCNHLTGKRDPRCATLFVIPTPESGTDGKADVKIILILSLPETPSSSCFQLPMKDSQSENNLEALDDNLDVLEKITQFFPASESDFIQGLKTKRKCLAVSSESKDTSQEPQSIDWLLYVKNSNGIQSQTQVQGPSSSSSSSCSSVSSSSSSSSGRPSPPTLCTDPTPAHVPGYVLGKVRSYHRLPPGTSWLEFIRGSSSDTTKLRQSTSAKTKPVRSHNTKCLKKGRRETSALLKYFQTKFQNEKS
ncbi:LOW QUALITY PROTEIN: casein kinase II subunit alpha'-interacting protein [Rattus rattus]|uniref:LOW QUALITY PROTEIN: casein kinase II subunit alpha'-interacting protein n=1 Tax=Rattus rattus TaxID=10117 RepID=UPI0013F32CBB|nr:LOW QUALITY PROTEIN: casein kinase II subunit alpha'-interacting protein [Rattus rattus]